jgi:hypothetical protein
VRVRPQRYQIPLAESNNYGVYFPLSNTPLMRQSMDPASLTFFNKRMIEKPSDEKQSRNDKRQNNLSMAVGHAKLKEQAAQIKG